MRLNTSKTRCKEQELTIQIIKELTIVKILRHSIATTTLPTEITLCEISQTWTIKQLEELKMLQINIFQNNSRYMPKMVKEWIQTETRQWIIEFLKLVLSIVPLETWIKKGQMSRIISHNHQLRSACNLGTPNLKLKLRSTMLWTILWRLHLHLLKLEDFKIQEL